MKPSVTGKGYALIILKLLIYTLNLMLTLFLELMTWLILLQNLNTFFTFDMRSAYHQVAISEKDKKFTSFEANGKLYQYCRIPFGVTNGVAAFQRAMDKLVKDQNLKETFPYLDNITVAGHSKEQHDQNVQKLLDVVSKRNITLRDSKTINCVSNINVLGYSVGNGVIKPDMDKLQPLKNLPPPTTKKSLLRVLGMFAYYAKWIPNFSDKIRPLNKCSKFPLSEKSLDAFKQLKSELCEATVDEKLLLTL